MNFYKQINDATDTMVAETQKLIQIKSIQGEPQGDMPFGKNMDVALDHVLSLAESMGFVTKKLNGYCGYAEYGEGDIYIGVLGHVDVNDENPNDWKHDPYGGIIEKDRIFGCASVDKGALIAALFALKAVKDSGLPMKRKVRLIIGTDERRQYKDIHSYLRTEMPPIAGFTVGGYFPVTYTEKGLSMFEFNKKIDQGDSEYIASLHGGKLDNLVPGHCCAELVTERKHEIIKLIDEYAKANRRDINAKSLSNGLLIETFGRERHCASIEKGINSIMIMLDFLKYINFGSDDFKTTIDFLCDKIGFDIYGENMNISYEDDFSGNTTINLSPLDIVGNVLTVRLDCRFPATCNFMHAIETINSEFASAGFSQAECQYWAPTYFPKNHFLIRALLDSYREVTGNEAEPVSGNSSSYSKVMPNVAAYGAHFPGESIIWDQTDEYIDIDSLKLAANIYANAIHRLCTEV